MKKILMVSLFSLLLGGAGLALAQREKAVSIGQRSEEVKTIQEALKSDKSIYPEGLVTGYFGQATQKAVLKLQAKCGLPLTGVVDENTTRCIFPVDYQVTVLSPNGGETWDRGQIQTVKWNAVGIAPASSSADQQKTTISPMPPVWAKASIDLFRKQDVVCIQAPCTAISVFVKHLATVNLFDGSYSWKISNDIANASDYVIRVSAGQNIMPLYRYEKEGGSLPTTEIWPGPTGGWDESDNPFTIEGKVTPPAPELKQVLEMLEKIAQDLARVTQLLREIIISR